MPFASADPVPVLSGSPILLICLGFIVGLFIGLTGLGGGAVVVPLLTLVCGMSQAKAQGTSLSIILSPLQAPAIYNYARKGNVDWHFLIWMAPGVLVGSFVGSYLANLLPREALKIIFALLLVYIGAYMLGMIATQENVKRSVIVAVAVTGITGVCLLGFRGALSDPSAPPPPDALDSTGGRSS
jgi:uncharacterized membrane protein YfcA